jgi:hypothetical protein
MGGKSLGEGETLKARNAKHMDVTWPKYNAVRARVVGAQNGHDGLFLPIPMIHITSTEPCPLETVSDFRAPYAYPFASAASFPIGR